MSMTHARFAISLALLGGLFAMPAAADTPFFFSTGDPDGKMATATRPDTAPFEIELADDFVLTSSTSITSATFTGLLPPVRRATQVVVEIYRVFPKDFECRAHQRAADLLDAKVPTRVNSPSDVEFDDRDSRASDLSFTTSLVTPASPRSTRCNRRHPSQPSQTTGGNGAVTGEEVQFNVTFTTPFLLPADHYFFVPQVELDGRRLPLAVGAETDRLARDAVPAGLHRPAELDPRCSARPRLAARRHGHRRPNRTRIPDLQRGVLADRRRVPEPSTWAMMLLGFAGLGYAAYRGVDRLLLDRLIAPLGPR